MRKLLFLFLSLTLTACTREVENGALSEGNYNYTGDPSELPLIQSSHLVYRGSFRVPTDSQGDLNYGGTGLGINTDRNSLLIVGHDHHQQLCEITIPQEGTATDNIDNLPKAQFKQPCTAVASRAPDVNDGGKVGGTMIVNGKGVGTQWIYYDASGSQRASHFTFDPTNLAGAVSGMFKVGTLHSPRARAGYMAPVPQEWQPLLGKKHLTGQAGTPIVSVTGFCQSAFGVDLENLGVTDPLPDIPYLFCPTNPAPPRRFDSVNPYFNSVTHVGGIAFVPLTRTLLFFGSIGDGEICYKCNGYGGYGPVNGLYHRRVWAYDAMDMVAVKNGLKKSDEVLPYAYWDIDNIAFPSTNGVGGVAFDPATCKLYVSGMKDESDDSYESLPMIRVFSLKLPGHPTCN
jgi:hypothetical protein